MPNAVRWPLKIEANTFQEFREQFNVQMTRLLFNMIEDNVGQAKLSCNFDISLINHNVEDPDTGDIAEILSPIIKHKITSTIQHKTEETGGCGTMEYQVVWNKRTEEYEMVPLKKLQQSMFEDGYEYGEAEDDG